MTPNPFDELAPPEATLDATLDALQRAIAGGGPQAAARWGPALDALRDDPDTLHLWRLTARRLGAPHPLDQALDALSAPAAPASLPSLPSAQAALQDPDTRRALVRDLLELPPLPPDPIFTDGLWAGNKRPQE